MASLSSVDPSAIGRRFGNLLYMNSAMTLLVAGIQLFMCTYGLSVFLETPREKRTGRLPYIIVSFVIFILFSIATSVDAIFVHDLFLNAATHPSHNMLAVYQDMAIGWNRYLSNMSVIAFMAIGDGVLLWRCTIVWSGMRWVCIPLYALYLTAIGLGIRNALPLAYHEGVDTFKLTAAWTFITVGVNVLATLYLSVRLMRQQRNTNILATDQDNLYSRITYMLIESAAPPGIFGLMFAIVNVVPQGTTTRSVSVSYTLRLVMAFFYYSLVALAPQIIIFRVTTGRSWLATGEGIGKAESLVFAHSIGIEQMKSSTERGSTEGFREGPGRPSDEQRKIEELEKGI